MQTARGNLRRDQALLADARLDLKRYEGLVKEDSIAVQQLDTQRALVDQYIGTIESDEGQVRTAEVNLIYTRIAAPATGASAYARSTRATTSRPATPRHRGHQPAAADQRDLYIPEDNVLALMKKVRQGATMAVEAYDSRQCRQAGGRHARHGRQRDRHHHRHREAAGAVRECGRFVVPQPSSSTCSCSRTC